MEATVPALLAPTQTEVQELPSGRVIELLKATPVFQLWAGKSLEDDYGGKAVLERYGRPYFAELLILEVFREEGWNGFWIDTYSNRWVGDMSRSALDAAPELCESAVKEIQDRCGSRYGCFDVVVERNGRVVFAEAKRASSDCLRKTQLKWIEAALASGIGIQDLLIIEWAVAEADQGEYRGQGALSARNGVPGTQYSTRRRHDASAVQCRH